MFCLFSHESKDTWSSDSVSRMALDWLMKWSMFFWCGDHFSYKIWRLNTCSFALLTHRNLASFSAIIFPLPTISLFLRHPHCISLCDCYHSLYIHLLCSNILIYVSADNVNIFAQKDKSYDIARKKLSGKIRFWLIFFLLLSINLPTLCLFFL